MASPESCCVARVRRVATAEAAGGWIMVCRVHGWTPARAGGWGFWALILLGALGLVPCAGAAAVFKCIEASGKVNYQASPCTAAQTAVVEPPPSVSARTQSSPSSDPTPRPVAKAVTTRDLVQIEADAKGAREAWQRMVQATSRGDVDAALRELTPSAQERYHTIIETATKPDPPVRFDQLGEVNAVTVSGGTRATIKVTRKKADGIYAYNVMLLKAPDGRWLIDMM
jgi:hypothetical protein